MQRISPLLWSDTEAEEAAHSYVSIFPHSHRTSVSRYPAGGPAVVGLVFAVTFVLDDLEFQALNAGPR